MKVGFVVDGSAEIWALEKMLGRVRLGGAQLLRPVYADMQPKATPGQIAGAAKSRVTMLRGRGADLVLVLIDLEDRRDCPGAHAQEIQRAFRRLECPSVRVVVKKAMFENWLIADPEALAGMSARFELTQSFRRKVQPNKADSVGDPCRLLDGVAVGKKRYHKRSDARQIASKCAPERIAQNSRSFRRLLRILGHPDYVDQSLRPAAARERRRRR